METTSAPSEPKIGGIDECGTGAFAGPYIACVAVFRDSDLANLPAGVRDSKKTSEKQRGMLYLPLCRAALDVGIGYAWPWEIDSLGPMPALQLAYKRALDDLVVAKPDLLIVDGKNRVSAWKGKQRVEPKADNNYIQVSAASMIGKFFRDTLMESLAKELCRRGLPDFGWVYNKGYGTSDHIEAIKKYGMLLDKTNHEFYQHRWRYCRGLKAETYQAPARNAEWK